MAFLIPPITGDHQLDSWTLRIAQQINTGSIPGAIGALGGGGGSQGNSALYLYQRTETRTPVPDRPTLVDFDFSDIENIVVTANEGWTAEIPDDADGGYLWVTFRYLSTLFGQVDNQNSWDTPELLSVPNISYEVDVSGFDFLRAEQTAGIELNATVFITSGDTTLNVTNELTAHNLTINWSKQSITSFVDTTQSEFDATATYAAGDEILFETVSGNSYNYVALIDTPVGGAEAPDMNTTQWEITAGSLAQMQDDNFDETGTTITVAPADVLRQTQFTAELTEN